jgi:hypothetical protein
MTADSVFQSVSHESLRDMIVTCSDASKKQLEALTLFMGRSLQMQRSSYDRRTLTKKIAPAVELMPSIDSASNGQKDPGSTSASS